MIQTETIYHAYFSPGGKIKIFEGISCENTVIPIDMSSWGYDSSWYIGDDWFETEEEAVEHLLGKAKGQYRYAEEQLEVARQQMIECNTWLMIHSKE